MMVPAGKSSSAPYRNPEFVWCCRLGYGWHFCVLTVNFKSRVCGNGIKTRASEFCWNRLWEFIPLLWNVNTISTYHLFCIYKYTHVRGGRGIDTTFFSCKYRDTFIIIPSCIISAQVVAPKGKQSVVVTWPVDLTRHCRWGADYGSLAQEIMLLRFLNQGMAF